MMDGNFYNPPGHCSGSGFQGQDRSWDHGGDSIGYSGERSGLVDERGSFGVRRGGFDGERGGFDGERGRFDGERGGFDGERAGFGGVRRGYGAENRFFRGYPNGDSTGFQDNSGCEGRGGNSNSICCDRGGPNGDFHGGFVRSVLRARNSDRGGFGDTGRGGFGDNGRGGFGDTGRDDFGGTGRGGFGFTGRGGFGFTGRGGFVGKKTIVEPHRHDGVFISRGAIDTFLTLNLVPGFTAYDKTRIIVDEDDKKIEYRAMNPLRSKLAAAIMDGIIDIHIKRGSKVLYLGAATGDTVSHVSDIVGPEGLVYAVESLKRRVTRLMKVANKRLNIVPIYEDARLPRRYEMIVTTMVDVIISDLDHPDQANILTVNANDYLKDEGHFIVFINTNCIDSSASTTDVVASEIQKFSNERLKPLEVLSLRSHKRGHSAVVGIYRRCFGKEQGMDII